MSLRWKARWAAALGIACAALTGCQTYPAGYGGMTLPSPHYLKHYPQYFAPDPNFPLQRELDSMQDPAALARPGAPLPGVAPLPPPIPVPPPVPANPVPNPGAERGVPVM